MFHIIIPTYNRSEKLIKTLESVVNQNFKYYVYIINDWSSDNTEYKLRDYLNNDLIKYIYKKNGWVWSARNNWIELVLKDNTRLEKDYIIFLDDDDLLKSDSLKNINDIIIKTDFKNIYLFSCEDQNWNRVTKIKDSFINKDISYNEIFCNNIWEWFWVFKASIFKNENFRFREDINWWESFLFMELWKKFTYHIRDEIFRIYYINSHESLISISKIDDIKISNYIYDYSLFLEKYWEDLQRYYCKKKYWEINLVLARFIALKWNKISSIKIFIKWFKYNKNIKMIFLYFIWFIDYKYFLYNLLLKYAR